MAKTKFKDFQKKTGFKWTNEFFELYGRHDGFGLKEVSDEKVSWICVPSHEIESLGENVRSLFSETHPEISKAFFPFYDWGSGDAAGYFQLQEIMDSDVTGVAPETIFEFDHENYNFDPCQPWFDFLQPAYESIHSLLDV